MSENPDYADFELLLAGGVARAWGKCLERWRPFGRVEDLPRGVHRVSYRPRPERWLGRYFANDYRDDYRFVADRLASRDPVEAACAHDILVDMIGLFADPPSEMWAISHPIPEWVRREIDCDGSGYEGFTGTTIGELFKYEYEHELD